MRRTHSGSSSPPPGRWPRTRSLLSSERMRVSFVLILVGYVHCHFAIFVFVWCICVWGGQNRGSTVMRNLVYLNHSQRSPTLLWGYELPWVSGRFVLLFTTYAVKYCLLINHINVVVLHTAGVFEGAEISMYYDPMICKLVTWAPERSTAIQLQVTMDMYGCGLVYIECPVSMRIRRKLWTSTSLGGWETTSLSSDRFTETRSSESVCQSTLCSGRFSLVFMICHLQVTTVLASLLSNTPRASLAFS